MINCLPPLGPVNCSTSLDYVGSLINKCITLPPPPTLGLAGALLCINQLPLSLGLVNWLSLLKLAGVLLEHSWVIDSNLIYSYMPCTLGEFTHQPMPDITVGDG